MLIARRGWTLVLLVLLAPVAPGQGRAREVEKLFEFLTNEYGLLLKKNTDWVNRAVAEVSLSRMPTAGATAKLLERVRLEKHPVARLVAWEALVARAPLLTEAEWRALHAETVRMFKTGHFHGDLRIALVRCLSATPVTIDTRNYFKEVFAATSSLDSADVPTLIAMGKAVRAWGDGPLYEALVKALDDPSSAVRAELVLKSAGANVPWTLSAASREAYGKWWQANKAKLTATKPAADGWKQLAAHYVPGPEKAADVDPADRRWRRELELGPLGLKSFDFAVSLDCSRSMDTEIERLKRDLRVMYGAFDTVSSEPRIGVTLFAPGTVRTIPLSGNINQLMEAVSRITTFGPAGDEEWAGSVERTIADSKWIAAGERNRRVIVLVSDEVITEGQRERLMGIAQKAAGEGFRIYCVPIQRVPMLPTDPLQVRLNRYGQADEPAFLPPRVRERWDDYRAVAAATGGASLIAFVPTCDFGLGAPPPAGDAGHAGAIAPLYPGGGPVERLLTRVLVDAINPQYADRVEPIVRVLVAYSHKGTAKVAERRSGFGNGLPTSFPNEPVRGGRGFQN